uniref:Putative RapB protein n=1 Tax=Bacillus licheniformis TaxID=1402 RepID=Q70JB0_BACLI|nr:putative RapB protein [Bacillus licheniformis]
MRNFILRVGVWMILFFSSSRWWMLKNKFKGAISCMKCKSLFSVAIILGVLTLGVAGFSYVDHGDMHVASRNAT